jgi:hypothetical protein
VVTDIKVIPSESLEGDDHRLLVADFRNIKEKKPIIYQEKKIKVWKLKEQETKEKYIEILKKKVPRGEIRMWKRVGKI